MRTTECVKCGYCCRVTSCPYGTWNKVLHKCDFLTEDNQCSKYEEIVKDKGSFISPAFGSGCSSRMFNDVRDRKIRELQRKELTKNQELVS